MVGETIDKLRSNYLQFVSFVLLRNLIRSMLPLAMDLEISGGTRTVINQDAKIMESLFATHALMNKAIESVNSEIDSGKLEIRDGTIHRVS